MADITTRDPFEGVATPVIEKAPVQPASTQTDEFAGIASPLVQPKQQGYVPPQPKDWKPFFSGVHNLAGVDNESKYQAIVESYMADKMPKLSADYIAHNSQAVLDQFSVDNLGLQGTHFTYQQAYDAIGKHLSIDPKDIKENNNPPWYWNKDAQAAGTMVSMAIPAFQRSIEKSLIELPDPNPEYFPDVPALGSLNPSLWAGVYKIIKPQLEGLATPEGIALMRITPALGAASEASKVAKLSLLTLQGLLVGVIFKSTYDQYPEVTKVINDPKSTTADRWQAIGIPVTQVIQGLIGAHELVANSIAGKQILKSYKDFKSVDEAVKHLNQKAEQTDDPELAHHLQNAADKLQEINNKPIPDKKKPTEEILSPDLLRRTSDAPGIGEGIELKGLNENSSKPDFDNARQSVIEVIHNLQSLDPEDKQQLIQNLETGGVSEEPGIGPLAMQVSDQIPEVANLKPMNEIVDRPEVQQEINKVNQDVGVRMNEVNLALREALELAGVYDPDLNPANKARLTRFAKAKLETEEVKARLAATKKELIARGNLKLDALRDEQRTRVANIKAAAEAKYGKLKTRASEQIESLKFLDENGRADYQVIRRNLLDLANLLPQEKRGKYLAQITDALSRPMITNSPEGMYRRTMNVSLNLLNELDTVEKQGIVDRINKKVQKSLDSPSVDVDYKSKIQYLVKDYVFNAPSNSTLNDLRRVQAYLDRMGDQAELPASVMQNLQLLSKTVAMDQPVNVLRGLEDQLDLQIKLGQKKYSSIQARFEAEKQELKKIILSGPANKWEPSKDTRERGVLQKNIEDRTSENAVKAIDYSVGTNRSLNNTDANFNNLEGNDKYYNGQLSRTFINKADLNNGAELNLISQATAPLKDLVMKHNFNELNAERISIHAIMQQEGGRERLLASNVKNPESVKLSESEMEFYNTARTILDEVMYPMIRRTMKELYNVDVPKVENYWPFQRDWTLFEQEPQSPTMRFNKGEELSIDNLGLWQTLEQDFIPQKSTKAERGFVEARKPEAEGAIKLNAFNVMDTYIRKAAHMVTNQRDLKMLGEITRSPEFKNKYGVDGQKYVLGYLDTIARNGSPAGATRSAWLDWLNKNLSVAAIGYRVLSNLKHTTNIPFALQFVKSDHLINGVNEIFTDRGKAFIKQNFPEVYTRAGGEFSIADLSNGTAWQKAQTAGFAGEKAIDSIIARAAVLGRYTQELEAKGLDWRNYDKIPIDKESQGYAIRISRQIVTSTTMKDLPSTISRSKNPSYKRAIFAFQNTMLRQWSYINQELLQKGIMMRDPKQAALATLVIMSVVASETTMERSIRSILSSNSARKEGDSLAKSLLVNSMRRVPLLGNVASALLYGQSGINLLDSTVKGLYSGGKLMFGKAGKPLSAREAAAAKFEIGVTAASLAGVPGASTFGGFIKPFVVPESQAGKYPLRDPSKSFKSQSGPSKRFATGNN